MRYIKEEHAMGMPNVRWEELAGPFPTLFQAESWLDGPPEDLGDPGTVTITRFYGTGQGFYVMSARSLTTGKAA